MVSVGREHSPISLTCPARLSYTFLSMIMIGRFPNIVIHNCESALYVSPPPGLKNLSFIKPPWLPLMSLSDTGTGKAPQSLSSGGQQWWWGEGGASRCNPRLYCVIELHCYTATLHCTALGWSLILSSQECQTLAAIIRMTGLSLSGVFLLQSGVITKACCWHCDANF